MELTFLSWNEPMCIFSLDMGGRTERPRAAPRSILDQVWIRLKSTWVPCKKKKELAPVHV